MALTRRFLVVASALAFLMFLSATAASAVSVAWTRQFGTSSDDNVFGTAFGGGKVYVSGFTTGSFEPSEGGLDAFVRAYDQAGNVAWTRQFGTSGPDIAYGLAADAAGNVYVGGIAGASLDGEPAFGITDGFVRKYTAAGTVAWTFQFGTDQIDEVFGVTVDAQGNVYAVGETYGTLPTASSTAFVSGVRNPAPAPSDAFVLELGQAAGLGLARQSSTVTTASLPPPDGFILKLDPAGDLVSLEQYGTSGSERALDVDVSSSGLIYIVGSTDAAYGGPALGGTDVYVRSLRADGVERWIRQFGTAGADEGDGIEVDSQGRPVVVGRVEGVLTGSGFGAADAYVRRYTASGAINMTKQFGTAAVDRAFDVGVDSNDNIYVSGLAGGALPNKTFAGGEGDAFVRRYQADGAHKYTVQFGTSALEIAWGIAVKTDGVVYSGGWTDGTLAGQTPAGARDCFLTKVRRAGS